MQLRDALAALRDVRRDEDVVITTMAPARDWMALAGGALHPLDLVLVPSAMGQATSMGLGLALAHGVFTKSSSCDTKENACSNR